MTKYKITRAEFYTDKKGKAWVIYFSVAEGNCYASMHDRTGLTDEESKGVFDKQKGYQYGRFRREHYRQVAEQVEANRPKSKISLN